MDIQTQPTQEGFYWLNDSRRYDWEVVRVFSASKHDKELFFHRVGYSMPAFCKEYDQWIGPLDKPS